MSYFYEKKGLIKPQEFPVEEKQYVYNELTLELEELPDKLNVVELVQSSKDTAFSSVLERFLPNDIVPRETFDFSKFPRNDDGTVDMSIVGSDIDELNSMYMQFDEIRSFYDLPDSFTLKQTYDYLSKKLNLGGIKDNEKSQKVESKIESEDVQTSSEESSQA